MHHVLDTYILVAGLRSPQGASAKVLRRTLQNRLTVLCSMPLFVEYEAVLLRPPLLAAAGLDRSAVENVLGVRTGCTVPVEIRCLWRPQLRDPWDDMVRELAVNGLALGDAVGIVTFNQRDFMPQAAHFHIAVMPPQHPLQGA